MNSKCIVCKNRNNCLTYGLGGLIGTWCDRFIEEPEITEEEQEGQEGGEVEKPSVVEKLIEKMKHF